MSSPLENAASPYLRAHKDNPVQWRVWGPEVLAEAKAKNMPILLSMGYVGCSWCETQNRESFSDPSLAGLINQNFIPVLTDREERPDLDLLYQGAAGAMGHHGGWPLNVFLNPEGEPFWVAGHLPVEDGAVPSFRRVLTETAQLFRNERAKANSTGANVRAALANLYNRNMAAQQENMNLDVAAMRVAQHFDIFFGGLLGTRKFLHPLMLELMWRAYLRNGAPQFNQLIFSSLDAMLFGGVYDHIGGGFFRHSQDERWMEPSFEKTLYDNAGMIEICTQAWQHNRNELCRQRIAETVGWLLRDMKVGNAFAAVMASGDEFENRAYYLWSEAEIDAALVGTFSARFKQVYGISRDGNMGGRNLPRRLGNPAPANEADEALLARQREMLLTARQKRKLPWRDERLLADWNGLMIAALARAGMVFEKPDWIEAATAAFDEVVAKLDDNGLLSHIEGTKGFADDYANMAKAALQLWEVTAEERFLTKARTWTRVMDEHFWSTALGGYFYYADDAEPLMLRPRMLFENPAPSANGTMLVVLTRLALLTGDPDYMSRGSMLAATFGDEANRVVNGSATFFIGFEYLVNSMTVLVVGPKDSPQTQELLRAYWGKSVPNGLLVQMEPDAPLPPGHPATGRGMVGDMPTAYICQAGACSEGFTSAATLADALTLPPQMRQQQSA